MIYLNLKMGRRFEEVIDKILVVLKDDPEIYEDLKCRKSALLSSNLHAAPENPRAWIKLQDYVNFALEGHPKQQEVGKILQGKD